jgi:hypothetical protein
MSAEEIEERDEEIHQQAVASGKIGGAKTGRMYSEAAAAVKKGNTTGVPKHSLDVYANISQAVSEAAAKMKAGDPKYTKWSQSLKSSNEKRADESNKKIERTLKGLYDSGKLKLIRSGKTIGMLFYGEKYFTGEISTDLFNVSERKHPSIVNEAYKLFDIDVSDIKSQKQKVKEVKNLMEGLDSKAKWLKSEA